MDGRSDQVFLSPLALPTRRVGSAVRRYVRSLALLAPHMHGSALTLGCAAPQGRNPYVLGSGSGIEGEYLYGLVAVSSVRAL